METEMTKPDRILRVSDVCSDSGGLSPRYRPQDESGWVPDGEYCVIDDDGLLRMVITYSHGVVHGPYRDFWSNGNVSLVGQYDNGTQHGVWHFYKKDGTLGEVIHFDHGREINMWSKRKTASDRDSQEAG